MKNQTNRRGFLKSAALGVSAIGGATALSGCKTLNFGGGKLFDISLSQQIGRFAQVHATAGQFHCE